MLKCLEKQKKIVVDLVLYKKVKLPITYYYFSNNEIFKILNSFNLSYLRIILISLIPQTYSHT
jgi:hypothetical protein